MWLDVWVTYKKCFTIFFWNNYNQHNTRKHVCFGLKHKQKYTIWHFHTLDTLHQQIYTIRKLHLQLANVSCQIPCETFRQPAQLCFYGTWQKWDYSHMLVITLYSSCLTPYTAYFIKYISQMAYSHGVSANHTLQCATTQYCSITYVSVRLQTSLTCLMLLILLGS